jgi:UDP-GlcNAc:undecaprenyl-phosphate GlcNAc-1-phosphate transferase
MQPLRQVEVAGNQLILNRVFLHKRRIAEVLLDFVFVCIAYYGAYFLRFEANLLGANLSLIRQSLLLVILVKMGVFFAFGLYRGTWRYISIPDFLTIFKVVSLGSIIAVLLLTFLFRFKEYSRAVFFLDWLLLLVLITGSRFLFRIIGEFFSKANLEAKKVFIFGAGDTGEMVIREIKRNKSLNYQPVGFIDDDIRKVGNKIQGVSVLGGRDKFRELIVQHQVKEIIIAIPSLSHEDMSMVTTVCGDCGIKFKRVKRLFEEEGDGGVGKN